MMGLLKKIEESNIFILRWKNQNYGLSKIGESKLHLSLFKVMYKIVFNNFIFITNNYFFLLVTFVNK